jgi:hypothetical protein
VAGDCSSKPSDWGITGQAVTEIPNRAARERQIGVIAGRQQHLITGRQLAWLGFSESFARRRVHRGRLFRVRHGVYATHPPPHNHRQLAAAAALSCGDGALVSDWPAAEILDIAPPDHIPSPAFHVTVFSDGGRGQGDLFIHRRGRIDPRDRRSVDGIPVTSADLTLVHLAPVASEIELEQILVAAESRRILKRNRLCELIAEREGQPGIARLRTLVALPPARVRSDKELYLIPLYRNAGLPRPAFNHPVTVPGRAKPLIVDVAWPGIRLAFELDTQRFHGDWQRAEEDRERDQLLGLVDWQCHRFHRRQLEERPREAEERARRLYEIRSGFHPPTPHPSQKPAEAPAIRRYE